MVARHPDHLCEAASQQVKRPTDLVGPFGDIPGDDQPVVRTGRMQRFGDRLIAQVTGVQVRDRPQCRLPTVGDAAQMFAQPRLTTLTTRADEPVAGSSRPAAGSRTSSDLPVTSRRDLYTPPKGAAGRQGVSCSPMFVCMGALGALLTAAIGGTVGLLTADRAGWGGRSVELRSTAHRWKPR